MKNRTRNSIIGLIAVAAIIIIIIAVAVANHEVDWQRRYYQELDGANYRIVAKEVNLREGPGTNAPIVGTLKNGQLVTTTGYTYEPEELYLPDGNVKDYWVELDNGYYVVNWALTGGRIN